MPREFMRRLRETCTRYGIVMIVDEVQCGMARTGKLFAMHHYDIEPDIMVMAKSMGGGMPVSAAVGRAELMDKIHLGGIGGTYSGNPVACAAALGVIEEIEAHGLLARARHIGNVLTAGLRTIATATSVIGDIRGRGAMVAAELVRPGTTEPNPEAVAAVTRYCHDRGVLTLTAGTFGNVLRFLPPLTISDDLLNEALGVLADAFAAL